MSQHGYWLSHGRVRKQDFKRMITASIWLINQKVKMIPVNDLTGKSDKSKPQV